VVASNNLSASIIMLAPALQTIALLLACFGVWKLCRHLHASAPRLTFLIIAGGFLFRVFAGSALFWISYLGLPLGRRLQTGRGFWFFAFDGMGYFDLASTFASKGLRAIAAVPSSSPSPFYVQILALFEYTFGTVASIGILLNVICYLITAAVLVWLSRRDPRLTTPVNVALLVLSFAPGCALWSLQPLKDSFFVCVLTLFVAVCVAWQELWAGEARRIWPRALALAAATFALVYAISSVRWYTAFAMWVTLPLFAIAIARFSRRRAAAFFATAGLMVIAGQAILIASSDYVPRPLAALLRPAGPGRQRELARLDLIKWLDSVRRGYDLTPGGTAITAGTLVPAKTPPSAPTQVAAAAPPNPAPASALSSTSERAAKPAEAKTVYEELVAADRARQTEQQSARMPVTRGGRIITGIAATCWKSFQFASYGGAMS